MQKLPELSYHRVGTALWEDRLTWYSENRASSMRLNLPKDSPAERGFTDAQSMVLFNMAAATPFDSALAATGLDEDTRVRFDTRQELQAPLKFGDLNVTPYGVFRMTAYDDDFQAYAGEDEKVRIWGGGGVRVDCSRAWNCAPRRRGSPSQWHEIDRLKVEAAPQEQ